MSYFTENSLFDKLTKQIFEKKSFLCVGLDPDPSKMPESLVREEDFLFKFNKAIVDATAQYAVAFKPNLAFYECHGVPGWQALQETIAYIKANYPEIIVIADAKRGDIGNTSKMYARAMFDKLGADIVTVAPYMGSDSIKPFLEYDEKAIALLALTSNAGSNDFQLLETIASDYLFVDVLSTSAVWGTPDNMMFVVGATQKSSYLERVREIVPNNFLLIPGVGAQGGSLEEVARKCMNKACGILVNSSRGIIHADNSENFAAAAAEKAAQMQSEMEALLVGYGLID